VWLKGAARTPTAVWTGSTNLSQGAIYGQANVGHWVRDGAAATLYLEYWNLLSGDPGGRDGDDRPTVLARNRALRDAVATLSPLPVSVEAIAPGVTPVFSPRAGLAALDLYASLIGGAARLACITFAFTIAAPFKTVLEAHTTDGPLSFLLLEKEDRPGKAASAAATETFVRLNSTNNVYEAFGSDLRDPLGQWVMETDTRQLGLNEHVMFIHCKFLLRDPLGADPIIVTGSANFSKASTNDNDENMMIIRGDRRAADIYFTEFNRLWNHYYFRSVVERTERFARTAPAADRPVYSDTDPGDLSLTEDDSWLAKYRPGTLRTKRVGLYTRMSGTVAT
jgi:phosphatidylserine/phosphatidylglycerophosphate/cardiolipin synthase-like enzyme